MSEYWDIELNDDFEDSFEYHQSELDTESSDEFDIVENNDKDIFNEDAENQSEQQSENSDDNDSYSSQSRSILENDERREALKFNQKETDHKLEKLARMLVVFSKILQSNYIFKEIFNLSESLN